MTLSKYKRLIVILVTASILLFIPFIAMLFSNEVRWNSFDFLIAGALLFGTGFSIEFVLRKFRKPHQRAVILLSILTALVLLWLELAVGIFGSPIAGS